MAGRSKDPKKRGKSRVQVQDALEHNPFAGLAGLAPELAIELAPERATERAPERAPEPQNEAPRQEAYRFAPKVILRREKKGRGGKTVTRVEGIIASPEELNKLARTLAKALGARAFVEEGFIWLSGDQCQSAQRWLAKEGAPKVVLGN